MFTFAVAAAILGAADQPYTDVPFVPTPGNVVDAMLDLAGVKPTDVLVDLGSGDGRIVIAAAKRFGIQATGVEIDPELVRQSETLARQEGLEGKARFVRADLFEYDLHQASVVMMYLTPGVNLRLRSKLLRELRPGTRVISHRFDMGSWVPAKTIQLGDDHIYLWVVPPRGSDRTNTVVERPAETAVPFEKLAAMFSYDAAAPLNFRSEAPESAEGAFVTPVSYAGALGPVSATIVTPSRPGKYRAVIFVHDYGKRDEFLPEALSLARAKLPAVSLLIDAPFERPVGWRRSFNSLSDSDNDREIHIQAVIDIRRGIDLLAARADVDGSRIAYVGHGYGANWGAILSSIAAAQICACGGVFEPRRSDGERRSRVGKHAVCARKRTLGPLSGIHISCRPDTVHPILGGRANSIPVRPLRSIRFAPDGGTVGAFDLASAESHLLRCRPRGERSTRYDRSSRVSHRTLTKAPLGRLKDTLCKR